MLEPVLASSRCERADHGSGGGAGVGSTRVRSAALGTCSGFLGGPARRGGVTVVAHGHDSLLNVTAFASIWQVPSAATPNTQGS
jgi:hypothetical protein